MLTMGIKPGHDGSIAIVEDGRLLWCLESEKDGFPRYANLTPTTILAAAEQLNRIPDTIALGGWARPRNGGPIAAGYTGMRVHRLRQQFFGREVNYFSSSHERSHIMMGIGMAPAGTSTMTAVLVWEGVLGGFYLVDQTWEVVREIPVLRYPGNRYAFLFSLADPTFADGRSLRHDSSGKLMALAAYGDADIADAQVKAAVEQILAATALNPAPKGDFADSVVYNVGVESEVAKVAAALLTTRIFDIFAEVAVRELPSGVPLCISGGCGLNCDWNRRWRELGHFSSVFVPPCTNDSGSAIGTAIDALAQQGHRQPLEWDVYSGLEFVDDTTPDSGRWLERRRDDRAIARAIALGDIVAWVQGRWEIGPRALGNRSLLAEPYSVETRTRLNQIKQREGYRPIAPCCREEDLAEAFGEVFPDPHMLYFRRVRSLRLGAVTHVDGTARVQTVSPSGNPELHKLLNAFAAETGLGVLCNTSLNHNRRGFVNRTSDLIQICEERHIDHMVIGDRWFQLRSSGRIHGCRC